MRVTAIDFETANSSPASVCAVGLSVLEDGLIEPVLETLIRPEKNVSAFYYGNIRIHGIRPQDVVHAPDFAQVYRQMKPYLDGSLMAAHNARFDMGCLKAACRNCGLPVPNIRWFDTLAISRIMFPSMEHHRLDDMCRCLHVDLDHHNAASDAYGCLMIVVQTMNLTGIFDIETLLHEMGVPLKTL
jgi:DNA polymerase-3 subunit epsilon